MDWPNVVLTFTGNAFLLAALGYYFDRRLKKLESELKLKGLIEETVFKNMAVTVKEATKRLYEFQRTVDAYCMVMPRQNYQQENMAMLLKYRDFIDWFAVESIHISDELKIETLKVFTHLQNTAFTKGMTLLCAETNQTDQMSVELENLRVARDKTEEIMDGYRARVKSAIGVG